MIMRNISLNKLFAASFILIGMLLWNLSSLAETKQGSSAGKIESQDKRFIDNGDGTITDTKTNLMWMRQESYQQTGHWLNWMESFDFVKKANEDGLLCRFFVVIFREDVGYQER